MSESSNAAAGAVKPKVDIKQAIFIGFGFFSAMIAWTYYNFKIPIILNGIKPSAGMFSRVGLLGTEPYMELVGGILMTLDNIIAILLQPWFGSLSDRLESRFGRRTPFMIIGLPTAVFCLFILPFMSIFGLFIAVIVVFNLAMSFYRSPIMSLMPDKTPPSVRSSTNAFISLMGGVGFVVGMLVPYMASLIPGTAPVPAIGNDITTQDYFWQDFWGFFLTGSFMLFCLLSFLIKVRETRTGEGFFHVGKVPIVVDVYTQQIVSRGAESTSAESKKPGLFDSWKEILHNPGKSLLWVLLAVFAYLFGFNALEFSFARYATSYLGIKEGTASLLLAIMPAMLIVFAIPAGYLAEKYSRRKIMKAGLLTQAAMVVGLILVMPLVKALVDPTIIELVPAMILLSIAGIGYGLTHINALPVVWQLSPKDKIGAYTGVYYMISSLGAILSPIAMSGIYTIISYLGGDQWLALFPYFLASLLAGFVLLSKAKRGDAEPLTKEDLAKLRASYDERG
nr:MFS transporter [Candidatus Sigynarchaeota archaeon]